MNFRMSLLKGLSLVVLLLLGVTGCPGNGPPSPPPIEPSPPPSPPPTPPGVSLLHVSHHNLLAFDDPGADSILTAASTVAQTNNGLGDVPCPVTLKRNGSITTFGAPSFINTRADFDAVVALPGQVKVVNQINWCGGLSPNIIGCAPVPGTSLVVVRFLPVSEGILWLHEYGHNKGLNHRDDPTAVMHPTLDQGRTMITAEECTKYMATPVAAARVGVMESRFDMAQGQGGTGQLIPVESFVRQTFVHGVPYATASQYGPETVPKLLAMLNAPTEKDHWANIVITLGIIGDPRAVESLIAFVEKGGDSRSNPVHYRAKTSALMAMGYLINKSGSQKAIAYLKNYIEPSGMGETPMHGRGAFQPVLAERDTQLSTMAILGLALSGHPTAKEVLQSLQRPATTESTARFQAQVSDVVSEALKTYETVNREGLANYYRESQR